MEQSSTLDSSLKPFRETIKHRSVIYEYVKQHWFKNVNICIISAMCKGGVHFFLQRTITNRFTKKQEVKTMKCPSFNEALKELHKWK